MAAWFVPVLKAILPHTGTIISAVAPAFTRKKAPSGADASKLVQEQIGELQAAATQNDANIRKLAKQLADTLTALEQSAAIVEKGLRRATLLAAVALGCSAISLAIAAFLAFGR